MPVQPVISLEQIVIIVAFLMMLFALMWFVRRHRGGITSRIHADRRMQHIEDLSLAPQQRLHLDRGGWSHIPCPCRQRSCRQLHCCGR